MPKIVYVTELRNDLRGSELTKRKESIFHFPQEEMNIIRNQHPTIFGLIYSLDDENSNARAEFLIQDCIIRTNKPVIIVTVQKRHINKFRKFVKLEIEGISGIDIIFLDSGDEKQPRNEDLFVSSRQGQVYPLYVNKIHYFERKEKLFRKKYHFDDASRN